MRVLRSWAVGGAQKWAREGQAIRWPVEMPHTKKERHKPHTTSACRHPAACAAQPTALPCPAPPRPLRSSFAILAANPASPATATVVLGPLIKGKLRQYSVRACRVGSPASCKSLQCNSASCGPIAGLASGKMYSGG